MSDTGFDDTNLLKRRKRKHKKAPEAPKKPLTPYIFYSKEVRESVKNGLPTDSKVTDIVKAIALKWKNLSDEEKEPYIKKAMEDKDREMDSYDGPMQIPINSKKNRKGLKHPDAPKRAMSPFLFFSKEKRSELKEINSEMKVTEMSAILGRMWRELSEEEKLPYLERSKEDRSRYNTQQSKFRAQQDMNNVLQPAMNSSILQNNQSLSLPQIALSTPVPTQNTWMSSNSYTPLTNNVVYPRISHDVNTGNNGNNNANNTNSNYNITSNISIPYHFEMVNQNSNLPM